MKHLSVVGKGYHTDEKVVGFYNVGDRVKFWGRGVRSGVVCGACFLAACSWPFQSSGMSSCWYRPGDLALSALGAALYSIGIPKDSVIQYETALKADSFLVMAHGTAEEMARAKAILGTANPSRLDLHPGVTAAEPAGDLVHVDG